MERLIKVNKSIKFTLYIKNKSILNYKNVIYLLIINKKYYVGKTKRKIINRLNEHVGNIIHYNDEVMLLILNQCNTTIDLNIKEKERIKEYGNKILKRYFNSKNDYENPLIFSNIKKYFLNKVI